MFSAGDANDEHDQFAVFNFIYHAKISVADAECVVDAIKFDRAVWSWIGSKVRNLLDQRSFVGFGQLVELFNCRLSPLNTI